VLVDDLDGTDAEETVSFAIDGSNYEIDLSKANATELRQALAPYIQAGRKVSGGRRRKGQRAAAATSASDIRQWARENGWDVPDRGRVSAEVREAYAAAH
jgi:hypothetical protein